MNLTITLLNTQENLKLMLKIGALGKIIATKDLYTIPRTKKITIEKTNIMEAVCLMQDTPDILEMNIWK